MPRSGDGCLRGYEGHIRQEGTSSGLSSRKPSMRWNFTDLQLSEASALRRDPSSPPLMRSRIASGSTTVIHGALTSTMRSGHWASYLFISLSGPKSEALRCCSGTSNGVTVAKAVCISRLLQQRGYHNASLSSRQMGESAHTWTLHHRKEIRDAQARTSMSHRRRELCKTD